jgi:hypothetical protein
MKIYWVIILMVLGGSLMAGQITGQIFYKDGSTCSSCKVSASIKRSGVTKAVYTDSKGKFTLTWSSNNSIDKLFVNGKTEKRNIKDGEHVVIKHD